MIKSRAIVLNMTKYTDEQSIVSLFTEQMGCVGMLVRLSRSKRTSIRHSLFQPMAILDVEWNHKPGGKLQRPRSVQVAYPFESLPYDPYKTAMALFLTEFLQHAVKNEAPSEPLFSYIVQSIQWLDTCRVGYANFHLVFLLRLTRFLGFMPNVEEACEGDFFDLRASVFTHCRPAHSDHLEPGDAALVPKLMRMRYDTMRLFKFNGSQRSRLLEYINMYYRLHLPDFPVLKSLAVLKQLF